MDFPVVMAFRIGEMVSVVLVCVNIVGEVGIDIDGQDEGWNVLA